MFWDQTVLGLFQKGGFCMWPLLACSVIGVAIILERGVYFLKLRMDYFRFSSELKKNLGQQPLRDVIAFCRKHANPVPHMAGEYLKNLNHDDLRSEILKREGSLAMEKVETRLRALAALTHIAPLLGLLGTVTGLVTAFHQIEIMAGQVQPGDLAAGIWEALITTVFGLVIAIPCMAAFHGFESAADRIARRMQFIVMDLDEYFGKKSQEKFQGQNVEATDQRMQAVK